MVVGLAGAARQLGYGSLLIEVWERRSPELIKLRVGARSPLR
jgi:hypothetical protein